MGKKHKHPEHENLERWLVSYADFITLLFATFVVLYAISQADLAKFKDFSVAVKQAFNPAKSVMENPGGVMKGTPDAHILKDSGNSILDKFKPTEAGKGPGQGGSGAEQMNQALEKINAEIAKMNAQNKQDGQEVIDNAKVKVQERGVVISFASSLFFSSGNAGLKPEAFTILAELAKMLKSSGSIVHVEGHTDNMPIFTAVYPSNWELSAARASSVVRFFVQKQGFDPAKLAAVGYADTRPIADNATAEGRKKNRRVDIVILSSEAVKDADAGAAQVDETEIYFSQESEGLGVHPVETSEPGADDKTKPHASAIPSIKPSLKEHHASGH